MNASSDTPVSEKAFANVTMTVLHLFNNSTNSSAAIRTILDTESPVLVMEKSLRDNKTFVLTFTNVSRAAGFVSTIGSVCLIIHILRSHHGLSTTYHRLMLGLCFGDVMLSFFVFVLGPVMVPEEMSYWVPGARGNLATCTLQGFLGTVGIFMTTLFNCCVCLYYLAIVKYGKREAYIRRKLEPWFHGISVMIALFFSLLQLFQKGFNTGGSGSCGPFPNSLAPHCNGMQVEDLGFTPHIPCGRGVEYFDSLWYKILWGCFAFGTIALIVGSMLAMYITVHNIEKRAQRYGVATLRLNALKSNSGPQKNENQRSAGIVNRTLATRLSLFTAAFRPCHHQDAAGISSRKSRKSVKTQKRAVVSKAAAYSLSWLSFWIPFIINVELSMNTPLSVQYMFAGLMPLSGFFNFVVFMMPKVKSAKRPRRSSELSWSIAFFKAYFSRGGERLPN